MKLPLFAGTVFVARLATWAPTRLWIPVVCGMLLVVPAIYFLIWDRDAFRNAMRLQSVIRVTPGEPLPPFYIYEGLSYFGVMVILVALVGVMLFAFCLLTRLAQAATEGGKPTAKPEALRVWRPEPEKGARTVLEGVVRSSGRTIQSPIGDEPCVAFGLHGDVSGVPIDDAEGGELDLELSTAERILVSLEHAELVASITPSLVEMTDVLDELLDIRGVGSKRSRLLLGEVVLRDGDEVTIEAAVVGAATVDKPVPYRGSARARVASGTEDAPLLVRIKTMI
ncbi:hypothetical protein BH11MYX4_BH11MYX4_63430 [soil metagenome]